MHFAIRQGRKIALKQNINILRRVIYQNQSCCLYWHFRCVYSTQRYARKSQTSGNRRTESFGSTDVDSRVTWIEKP